MRILVLIVCVITVTVARGDAQCLGDFNGDGKVTIGELITAVDNALNGCQSDGTRFLDNGDGTITDHKTGLMWEKKDLICPGLHCYSDTFTWCSCTFPSCTFPSCTD